MTSQPEQQKYAVIFHHYRPGVAGGTDFETRMDTNLTDTAAKTHLRSVIAGRGVQIGDIAYAPGWFGHAQKVTMENLAQYK